MSNVPLPGHWKRDDGQGSAEHFGLTAELIPGVYVPIDEKFEDEVPVASPVPISQPTPEELAAQLVNAPKSVPAVNETPSPIAQILTEAEEVLAEKEKIAAMLNVPVEQVHRLAWTPEEAAKILADREATPTIDLETMGPLIDEAKAVLTEELVADQTPVTEAPQS